MPCVVDLADRPGRCGATICGASPSDGSSSSSRRGPDMRARPIASICCSPPESRPARWRARSASTGNSSCTRSRAAEPHRGATARRARPPAGSPRRSSARRPACPRARRRRRGGRSAPGRAGRCGRRRSVISPAVTAPRCSARVPDTARRSVDLPAPLPPSTARTPSPATETVTSSSAPTERPYRTDSPRTSSTPPSAVMRCITPHWTALARRGGNQTDTSPLSAALTAPCGGTAGRAGALSCSAHRPPGAADSDRWGPADRDCGSPGRRRDPPPRRGIASLQPR